MKLKSKITLTFLTVLLLGMTVLMVFGYLYGKHLLEKEAFNHLTSVRENKATQIKDYFQNLKIEMEMYSHDPTVLIAAEEFIDAFHQIDEEFINQKVKSLDTSKLRNYYTEIFLPRLNENDDVLHSVDEYLPGNKKSAFLQQCFIAENPYELGRKDSLFECRITDSRYSRIHSQYHHYFRRIIKSFGYYDLFIIDASGNIVYSVFKETDYATNLLGGPYSETGLALAFKGAMESQKTILIDFKAYPPSYNAAASFIATPIYIDEALIGVFAMQVPIDEIEAVMTGQYRWEKEGLGKSGETYLVGEDQLMRNNSRFFIEDRENYLKEVKDILPDTILNKIEKFNTTILLNKVVTEATVKALKGEEGTDIIKDYRDINVLSSFAPLDIEGVNWIILSEIDKSEALSGLLDFIKFGSLFFILTIVLLIIVSIITASKLSKPIIQLAEFTRYFSAQKFKAGDAGENVIDLSILNNRKDEVGDLGRAFHEMKEQLGEAFSRLQQTLKEKDDINAQLEKLNQELETKVKERTVELEKAMKRVSLIIENSADAIISINTAQIIQHFNPSAERIFGYSQEEVIGKSLTILMTSKFKDSHFKHIESFAQENQSSKIMGERLEISGVRKDGTEFPAEAGISKLELDGEIMFTAFLRDITERKKAEDQIKRQKEMLENTLESLSHPFYVIDAKTYEIQIANTAARQLGIKTMTRCHQLTHKMDEPCNSENDPCPLEIIKKTKKPCTLEHVHYDKDGNESYAEVHGFPIFDEQGNVIQMIEYSLNITERKEMERKLEKAFETISVQKERMEHELNVGHEIQMGLVPLIFPAYPNHKEFNLHGFIKPAKELGGDFYDYGFVDDEHFFFCIGDVSDKGVASALFMAVTKTLFKHNIAQHKSISQVMSDINNEISFDNTSNMFVTLFGGIMNIKTGAITFTNAGHNPTLIRRKNGELEKLTDLHGPIIGAMEGLNYREGKRTLNKGDVILMYTDGITEAKNIAKDMYSDAKLEQLFSENEYTSPQNLVHSIADSVAEFAGEAEQSDDITMLAIEYIGVSDEDRIDEFVIKITNDINEIGKVTQTFKEFSTKHELAKTDTGKFNIVFDEILNNIINYGYQDDLIHYIEIQVELYGNHLNVKVIDDGEQFNPLNIPPPDVTLDLNERELGGLGIHMVKKFMDQAFYAYRDKKNILTLVKHINKKQ